MTDASDDDLLAYRFVEAAQARADEIGRDVRVMLASAIILMDRKMVEDWITKPPNGTT